VETAGGIGRGSYSNANRVAAGWIPRCSRFPGAVAATDVVVAFDPQGVAPVNRERNRAHPSTDPHCDLCAALVVGAR
jgi:hypothetical protein